VKACIKHTPVLKIREDEAGRDFQVVCKVCGAVAEAEDPWYECLMFRDEVRR
jgi:hypothetical protein